MNYKAIIEAILFTMGESVELEKISSAIDLDQKQTKKIIEELQKEYEDSDDIGMSIIELDGSYQMCTKPRMYEYLIKIAKQPKKRVLSDVLLETLSIIAYKQPVTKAEIEKIRIIWRNSCYRSDSKNRCKCKKRRTYSYSRYRTLHYAYDNTARAYASCRINTYDDSCRCTFSCRSKYGRLGIIF